MSPVTERSIEVHSWLGLIARVVWEVFRYPNTRTVIFERIESVGGAR